MSKSLLPVFVGSVLFTTPAFARTLEFDDVGVSIEVPDAWQTRKEDTTMTYVASPSKASRVGLFHLPSDTVDDAVTLLQLQMMGEDDDHTLDGPKTLAINGMIAKRWTGHQAQTGGFTTEIVLTQIDAPSGAVLTFSTTTVIPGIEDGSDLASILASIKAKN
jgi:hypothetical protein